MNYLSTFDSLWEEFFANFCRSRLGNLIDDSPGTDSLRKNFLDNFNFSTLRFVGDACLNLLWWFDSVDHHFGFSTGGFSDACFLWSFGLFANYSWLASNRLASNFGSSHWRAANSLGWLAVNSGIVAV